MKKIYIWSEWVTDTMHRKTQLLGFCKIVIKQLTEMCTPHLQQVLGAVYLIVGANYRNDTIIRSFIRVSNGH